MCGITGYKVPVTVFDPGQIHKMNDCISHRGPDAEGVYVDEANGVALGHRRLSILDLSHAADQPMHSACGKYVIVFNGEVYNFKELTAELNLNPKTSSDTEIILEAFAAYGPDVVNKFNGMFSFVIYNKHDHSVVAYRDRIGVKPFYYYWDGTCFAFASEVKALLELNYVQSHTSVNKQTIYTYLHTGYATGCNTFFKHIYKLSPGHSLQLNDKILNIKPYWQLTDKIAKDTISDESSAKKTLDNLLHSSVSYRMISDVPFGSFLSGGIDSSTVTAIAQKNSAKPLRTFSIAFKEASFNEAVHARKIADYLKTDHTEFLLNEEEALQELSVMLESYDMPLADSSCIPTMLVSKLARKHVTMVLSGDGGDELFMGYGAYNWSSRLENPLLKASYNALGKLLTFAGGKYSRQAELLSYKGADLIPHIISQDHYFFSQRQINNVLTNSGNFTLQVKEPDNSNLNRKLSRKELHALYDLQYYMPDDLMIKVDVASMRYSLEARTPFLDYRIVEFALNLNASLKVKNGHSKYLLKQVLYDYIPESFFDRPKWGFGMPLAKWLTGDLSYLIDQYLNSDIIEEFGLFSPQELSRIIHRFKQGEHQLYNKLWLLILCNYFLKNVKTTYGIV